MSGSSHVQHLDRWKQHAAATAQQKLRRLPTVFPWEITRGRPPSKESVPLSKCHMPEPCMHVQCMFMTETRPTSPRTEQQEDGRRGGPRDRLQPQEEEGAPYLPRLCCAPREARSRPYAYHSSEQSRTLPAECRCSSPCLFPNPLLAACVTPHRRIAACVIRPPLHFRRRRSPWARATTSQQTRRRRETRRRRRLICQPRRRRRRGPAPSRPRLCAPAGAHAQPDDGVRDALWRGRRSLRATRQRREARRSPHRRRRRRTTTRTTR